METLQTWARALLDFAYPPHCAVCEADIEAAELLCESCWAKIVPRRPHSRVEDGGRAFEKIVALGPFTGALQQAIYALKFRNQVRLGRELGERMGQRLAEQLAPLDCLLPVPLHPARQRERGFNQSAEIAAGLGAALGVPVCHGVVRRQRNTRQQAFLSAEERRANIRGAFASVAALPASFRIGIVDDVWTTGETIADCAQAVESDRLWAVVLARSGAGDLLT
ncbi:MAG: ComF family protein [Candidatus Latescibacteria bacterium]|nr:ComF family protein [Candidatus Latescibacterota bacterium]